MSSSGPRDPNLAHRPLRRRISRRLSRTTHRVLMRIEQAVLRTEPSPILAAGRSPGERDFVVMVPVAHPDRAGRIARMGAAIAGTQGGEVLIVHVVGETRGQGPERGTLHRLWAALKGLVPGTDRSGPDIIQVALPAPADESAIGADEPLRVGPGVALSADDDGHLERWPALDNALRATLETEVPVSFVVRHGANVGRTLRRTAVEEQANLILLGWREDLPPQTDSEAAGATLKAVLEEPPCDVAVLGGEGDGVPRNLLVPIRWQMDSRSALRLAHRLTRDGGSVTVVTVLREGSDSGMVLEARRHLQHEVSRVLDGGSVDLRVTKAPNAISGILRCVDEGYDGIVMSVADDAIFDRMLFGRTQRNIAEQGAVPVMVTKAGAGPLAYLLRRGWRAIYNVLPNLSSAERSEVGRSVADGAAPTIDFYVMIGLSAAIAGFGLMINSAAVVIGAMLVAPLLSAMVGVGLGVVEGDVSLLRNSVTASLEGAALAVVVGWLVGLAHPTDVPQPELLARTQPNLFDLGIALASGAAGAYAVSRKNVQEAVAGVAIAAAVIPPLAAAGVGVSLGSREIALGALLLFFTNFVAIALAGAIVFLLLGFGPMPEEEEERQVLRSALRSVVVMSVVVAAVLATLTWRLGIQEQFNASVDSAVRLEVEALGGRLENVSFEREAGRLQLEFTAQLPDGTAQTLSDERVDALADRIGSAVGIPVDLRIRMIPFREFGQAAPIPTDVN